MSTSRRRFLQTSAAAGAAAALGNGIVPGIAGAATETRAKQPVQRADTALDILILGGTGFTGPHQIEYALARGHRITVFNRGRRDTELPAAVEQLQGDRNEPNGLEALKGNRRWDVIIDNPTTLPHWVRDAGQILQGRARQYIFISTISVYADNSIPWGDEFNVPLAEYEGADPLTETFESFRANPGGLYGPLKVASEREAEKWFPGMTTIIRPGLIVGPRDETGRFTYWPMRVERGGDILAPNSPEDPTQVIDGRDLAQWTIRMAEQNDTGVYNATGPRSELTMGELLGGMRATQSGDKVIDFIWVPLAFLQQHEVNGWSDMPIWVPQTPDNAGFSRVNIERAVAKGLTFRPLMETTLDTIAWVKSQTPERQARLVGGIAPEKEAAVIAAWKASQAG